MSKTKVFFDEVVEVLVDLKPKLHDNGGDGVLRFYVPLRFKGKKFSLVIQEKEKRLNHDYFLGSGS